MFYSRMDIKLDNERSHGRMIFILGLIISIVSLYLTIDVTIRSSKYSIGALVVALIVFFTSLVSTATCMWATIMSFKLGG